MKNSIHARIAYLAGRLISGKNISSLYDYSRSAEIAVQSFPDAQGLSEFAFVSWSHMVSSQPAIGRFTYSDKTGGTIQISIKGRTFIGYSGETSSHFIGMVRGDSVNIFDHKASLYFNFKINQCDNEQVTDCRSCQGCQAE